MNTKLRRNIVLLGALVLPGLAICPNGFVEVGTECYGVSTDNATAEDSGPCDRLYPGAWLATVESEDQLEGLKAVASSNSLGEAYIGLNRVNSSRNKWVWENPSTVTPSAWYKSEPRLSDVCACLCRTGICVGKLVSCDCTINFLTPETGTLCLLGVVMPSGECFTEASADGLPLVNFKSDNEIATYMSKFAVGGQLIRVALYNHLYDEFLDENGVLVDFRLWEEHEPDTNSCVYLGGLNLCAAGKICDHSCDKLKKSLCEYIAPPPCIMGATEVLGKCYIATPTTSDWDPTDCGVAFPGTKLAGIKTATEFQQLYAAMGGSTTEYWLNITRFATSRAEDKWSWYNVSEPYTSAQSLELWDLHSPSSYHSCTIMTPTGLMDYPCASSNNHLCESPSITNSVDCTAAGGYFWATDPTCFLMHPSTPFLEGNQCDAATGLRLAVITTRTMQDALRSHFATDAFVGLSQMETQLGWEWTDPAALRYDPKTFDLWKASGSYYPMKNDSCATVGNTCTRACSSSCFYSLSHLCQVKATATIAPTAIPTEIPTPEPTLQPTLEPTLEPTLAPNETLSPTEVPKVVDNTTAPVVGNETDIPETNIPATGNETGQPTVVPSQGNVTTPTPTVLVTAKPTPEPVFVPGTETTETVTVLAAGAGAVTSLVSPSAAIAASQMAILISGCHNDTDWHHVPWMMHPLQFEIADNIFIGAVICNVALIVCITILHAAFTTALLPVLTRFKLIPLKSFLAGQGLLRVPSASLFVFLFLYQGTVFSSMKLVLSPRNWWSVVVGVLGWAVCFFTPIAVSQKLSSISPVDDKLCFGVYENPQPKCRYRLDTTTRSTSVLNFLIGPGEWVSTDPICKWDDRYTVVLRPYTERAAWIGASLPFMLMTFLALVNTMPTKTYQACGNVKLCSGLCYVALTISQCILRPYARPRDLILEPLISLVYSVDLFIMAHGFYQETRDGPIFDAAALLSQVALFVVMLKAVIDLLTEIYVLFKRRRDLLQEEEYQAIRGEKDDSDGDSDNVVMFTPSFNDGPAHETPLLTRSSTRNMNELLSVNLSLNNRSATCSDPTALLHSRKDSHGFPNPKWTNSSSDSLSTTKVKVPRTNVLLPATTASAADLDDKIRL
eukprot:TRINITY_DN15015_c0_g1_i1.p1 TRINITY_DN15015_c0_g1~~TRINITY_DN15015_c0_g1_i1.p1  ORF type:complete len:1125 (+),score=133.84 TRINITY_DN15015_c0_g1_i1:74-3448(+)